MTMHQEKWEVGQSLDEVLREKGLYETVTIQTTAQLLMDLSSDLSKIAKDISKLAVELSKIIEESTHSEQKLSCESEIQQTKTAMADSSDNIVYRKIKKLEENHVE